jgi:hypothetical protein
MMIHYYLHLDPMLNDVKYLLWMLINLHKNEYELELMLMNVQMNLRVYNEYHVNINLTRLLNLEQKMMDKESLEEKKKLNIFMRKKDRRSLLLFLIY